MNTSLVVVTLVDMTYVYNLNRYNLDDVNIHVSYHNRESAEQSTLL
jgi:hypothetical protein